MRKRNEGAPGRENPGRGIELAGKRLYLRYTVNSLCEVEAMAGMPIDCLLNRHFSAARLLLWAGLTADQPELTVRDAGDLIGRSLLEGGSLDQIVALCAEGMREAGLIHAGL